MRYKGTKGEGGAGVSDEVHQVEEPSLSGPIIILFDLSTTYDHFTDYQRQTETTVTRNCFSRDRHDKLTTLTKFLIDAASKKNRSVHENCGSDRRWRSKGSRAMKNNYLSFSSEIRS